MQRRRSDYSGAPSCNDCALSDNGRAKPGSYDSVTGTSGPGSSDDTGANRCDYSRASRCNDCVGDSCSDDSGAPRCNYSGGNRCSGRSDDSSCSTESNNVGTCRSRGHQPSRRDGRLRRRVPADAKDGPGVHCGVALRFAGGVFGADRRSAMLHVTGAFGGMRSVCGEAPNTAGRAMVSVGSPRVHRQPLPGNLPCRARRINACANRRVEYDRTPKLGT
jgi:hypothetical protein